MRFDELSLRIPGDELRMRFHDKLTVLTGIGALERQALIEGLLGTLTGTARQSTALSYRDDEGRRVHVTRDSDGRVTSTFDDGTAAPDLVAGLGFDATSLNQLCRVSASDVSLLAGIGSVDESPELRDARQTLRALSEELESAIAARDAVEAMRLELHRLDERIRDYDDGQARRRYARLLAELEQVRAEAAAIRGGEAGAEADRRFVAAAEGVHQLAATWRAADAALARARAHFGDRERLDARTLAEGEAVPENVPEELDGLVRALEEAEGRRDRLAARLQELAAAELPEPSTPDVVRLAHADQEAVWAAARAVLETEKRLEQASLDLGGLPAEGTVSVLAEALEEAHEHVDCAERLAEARRPKAIIGASLSGMATVGTMFVLPVLTPVFLLAAIALAVWGIVLPRRGLAAARRGEDAVLAKAGIGSYLGFHIRRIDATIDPSARERLNVTALEHRVAQSHWHEIAGDLEAIDALRLEAEVRAYTEALASLEGAADEIEAVRQELAMEAEPAAAAALARLMTACEPYGVDDPSIAAGMVRHQVELGSAARLQRELMDAEAAEQFAATEIDAALSRLGFAEGGVDARIAALDVALAAARDRDHGREQARPREIVEAELAELEARARREHQPEWGASIVPDATPEPDIEELRAQRESTAAAYESAARLVPDVERLSDRRNAVERRVNVLEAAQGDSQPASSTADTAEVERYLLARVAAVRNAAGGRETLPLILEEPFQRIRGERKWEILDLVERLSASAQLVYLSNDPDVQLWARRRAASNSLMLLEPVAADATV